MHADHLNQSAMNELGSVVLRCRNRRRSSSFVAVGGSPLSPFLTPPLIALMLTLPIAGIAMWQKIPPPLYKHPIWGPILGLWFGAWCIGSYWYYLTAPSGVLLVLHERGLRYRRHIIPFDQLARIRPGMSEARIVDWVNRITGSANKPRIMSLKGDRLAERARQASVTLEFRESRPLALRSLLVKHDADDLDRFFSTIATQHPELIDEHDISLFKSILAK